VLNLEPAAQHLATLVAGVRDDQLDAPTPCPDYSLGDLLDHVAGVALAFAAAGAKERGPNMEPPRIGDRSRLGDDWRTQIPVDLEALPSAWRDARAWEGNTWIAGMEMPAETIGRVGLDELVVHGWDVARASGQRFDADPASIAGSLEFIEPISAPGMEAARAPAFGDVIEPAEGASALDRLLALTGRDPAWSST
jgi:uncharacterized protein (TIGR03086 family)